MEQKGLAARVQLMGRERYGTARDASLPGQRSRQAGNEAVLYESAKPAG